MEAETKDEEVLKVIFEQVLVLQKPFKGTRRKVQGTSKSGYSRQCDELAAYLRLNLTSKEISIMGVETSRYRLRKKLDITNEVILYDHLINMTNT